MKSVHFVHYFGTENFAVMRLAVDYETGNVFYTGNNEAHLIGYIGVVNEKLGLHQVLVQGLKSPADIVLSLTRGYVNVVVYLL